MTEINTPVQAPPTPRRRFGPWLRTVWQRFVSAWRGPEPEPPSPPPPPPPPPGKLVERYDLDPPIAIAARGHVFNFYLHATFVWTSDGLPRSTLKESMRRFGHLVRRDVRRIAATTTRNYPAHRVREAEAEVQKAVGEIGSWRFGVDGTSVTCRPYPWLRLDDSVKEQIRPYAEKLIQIECAHDVEIKRAQMADRLSRQWLTVLEKIVDNPLAAGAARLTEDAFAEVVAKIKAEQEAATQRLEAALEKLLDSAGPYEQAESFDLLVDLQRRRFAATAPPAARSHNGAPKAHSE